VSKSKFIHQVEPYLDKDDKKSIIKYLDSGGWLTEHMQTYELENKIKNFVNRKYAIAVPNGTIAIYLALLANNIGKGKKVAVPNLTMIATINAVIWSGAEPVIIDTDDDMNMCMSYEKLISSKNIDAVIYVPLNGRTKNGLKIQKWCKENNKVLIEDSAHALGSKYNKTKMCGSLGEVSVLSFTPHKIITMGQGGMVLTDKKKIYDQIIKLKTFNRSGDKSDWHQGFGLNFKITDLQSSLGLSQFDKLEIFIKNKKRMHKEYSEKMTTKSLEILNFDELEVPWFIDSFIGNKTLKKLILKKLDTNNIGYRDAYPPLSSQKYLKNIVKTDLTNSLKTKGKIIWLPSSNGLSKAEINRVASVLNTL
jgi:perosamine synthetase